MSKTKPKRSRVQWVRGLSMVECKRDCVDGPRIVVSDARSEWSDGHPSRGVVICLNEPWEALLLLSEARKAVEYHRERSRARWSDLDKALKEQS